MFLSFLSPFFAYCVCFFLFLSLFVSRTTLVCLFLHLFRTPVAQPLALASNVTELFCFKPLNNDVTRYSFKQITVRRTAGMLFGTSLEGSQASPARPVGSSDRQTAVF